jgi:hypothetical protein
MSRYSNWENFFPDEKMVKIIHIITAGKEKLEKHLSGIAKFKADEVLLFSNGVNTEELVNTLEQMGISYRIILCNNTYLDVYRKANEEGAAAFVDDAVVAINVSTGPRIMQSAIEDAYRLQLIYFYRRSSNAISSAAFRYYVPDAKKENIKVAPLWNIYSKDHNDIFETLAESNKHLTMKSIWESIVSGREDITFESFRKVFRDFKRWFKNTPYFEERVKRGPEYKLKLE